MSDERISTAKKKFSEENVSAVTRRMERRKRDLIFTAQDREVLGFFPPKANDLNCVRPIRAKENIFAILAQTI